MKPKLTAALAVCLAALGLAAGLFAFPARADNTAGAHNMADLWALGYRLGIQGTSDRVTNPLGCANFVVLSYGDVEIPDGQQPTVELNPDPSKPGCRTPDAEIQANIDAIIAAYPPAPITRSWDITDPVTTTAPTTTTVAAPADAPPATPTPAAAPVQTVTVTDPTLQAQLDALNAKLDALNTKVDKLAVAGTAAWDAFVAATGAGASAPDAALAARSGYLNSLYGL